MELLRSSGRTGSLSAFDRAKFVKGIADVSKTEAGFGFVLSGILACLDGDIAEVDRCFSAARHLKEPHVDAQHLYTLSNLGYAKRTLSMAKTVIGPQREDLSDYIRAATWVGGVVTSWEAVQAATANQMVLAAAANAAIDVAKRSSLALKLAGRTQDELVAVIDVAGEVLRSHRLLWLGAGPDVIALDGREGDESAPGVHYLYRVEVDEVEATEMNDEIVSALVSRDLDRPGLSVSFMASKHAQVAAA